MRGDPTEIQGGGIALLGFVAAIVLSLGLALVAILVGASSTSLVVDVSAQLGLWVGLFAACVLTVRRYGNRSLRRLGLAFKRGDLRSGLLAALLQVGALVVLIVALVPILPQLSRSDPGLDPLRQGPVSFLIVTAIVVVGAPFFEELYFRGLVQGVLTRRWGPRVAIFGQAVAFGLVHYRLGMTGGEAALAISSRATFGVIAGSLRWRHQRLGPGLIAHASLNAFAIIVSLLPG